MCYILRNQRGSTAVLAIVAMVFLGIVIAGLLPMLDMELKSAATDRDALQAQYAAEAGVKRALMALDEDDTAWAWLGANNWRNVINDGGATYAVTISPAISDGSKPQKKTTFTITAYGKAGGITRSATASYTTPNGGNWGGDNNPNPPNPPPLSPPMPDNYTSYNIGTNLTIDKNANINGGTIATSATTINNNAGLPVLTGISLTVPTVPVSLDPVTYSGATPLSGALPSGTHALAGTYNVSGDFNTNNKTVLSATGGPSADVTIYATGNINISDNIVTNGSTNLTLISNGSININSNVNLVGNIQLYSREDLVISSNTSLSGADLILTGYGLFMAGRDLTVNANVNLNKAVLVAGRDITINSNSTITGQIMAGRNLTLNSNCTINLAPVL